MSTDEMRRHAGMAAHYEPFQRFMYAIGFMSITDWGSHGGGLAHYYADFSRLPESGIEYGNRP
jgi:hypothetical protein